MRKILMVAVVVLVPVAVIAHLCNDVFDQAQDNLAVKVDVRDGQLRIGKEASFRVYLLNTMDRVIVNINLEIKTDQFEATVKPSPEWKKYPALEAVKAGGTKQYFEVTLKRKPNVADGKYKIGLHLFNGQNKSQVFKTVDLDQAACSHEIKKGTATIDGNASDAEWKDSDLCTDLYTYEKGKYMENKRSPDQSRFRVKADEKNLYCMISCQGGKDAESDTCTVYVSPDADSSPVKVTVDRKTGAVTGDKTEGIEVKRSEDGTTLECKIPRANLGVDKGNTFLLNFTRTQKLAGKEKIEYWRGNNFSVGSPVVYDRFTIASK